ncbi:HK97 family phage portal protein [Roseovarius atlanticus]|uniref:HK97 family phage portal protein n=1 Tax=Roseovarius atlanticus TaxID=1641875 RepID=A0A0T5NQ24_9RHOB|nr:phage portal protein [Roseovarius atlanticus]KRS11047.1 HK97 family phage portal protein [Roseovarius atlanticus]
MPFDKLKKALGFSAEEKALTLADPDALTLFGVLPTTSGVSIGPGIAMRVPAVACAVGLISETIGSLPVKLHDRASKAALTNHPAYRLVHDEANEWTSAAELRRDLTLDALQHGAGHAQVIRTNDGTPYELHRMEPGKVQRDLEPDGEPFYRVTTNAGQVQLSFRDVLRIEAIGGVSPIVMGREAIALALSFESHIGGIFANGGRPSGVIKAQKVMDVEAKKKVASSWFATHGGSKAGGTAILDEGMDYTPLSMTLADTQFAENRLEQIREIARVFRVPPTMLFELSRGTWSNTEEMARQFMQITLKPWLTDWAWAYARCLLTPEERKAAYFEAVTDDLLRTDTAARATAYGQYRSMGVMTANEVRAAQNLPPLPGGNELSNPYTSTDKDPAA